MSRRNPIELVVHPQKVVPFERRPNAESLRSNFLARFNRHFLSKPDDELFEQIYRENPALYFSSLVQLAKVLKVEVGEAGAFDPKPRSWPGQRTGESHSPEPDRDAVGLKAL